MTNNMTSPPPPFLVFLHIPRTAGTHFKQLVLRAHVSWHVSTFGFLERKKLAAKGILDCEGQIMAEMNASVLIEVCTASGREEAFVKCQTNLALCQKSLSDYLEVKRKKFPRFYFISAVDLVDILSKGRNPPLVQARLGHAPHLTPTPHSHTSHPATRRSSRSTFRSSPTTRARWTGRPTSPAS